MQSKAPSTFHSAGALQFYRLLRGLGFFSATHSRVLCLGLYA